MLTDNLIDTKRRATTNNWWVNKCDDFEDRNRHLTKKNAKLENYNKLLKDKILDGTLDKVEVSNQIMDMIAEQERLLSSNVDGPQMRRDTAPLISQDELRDMKRKISADCKDEGLVRRVFALIEFQQDQVEKIDKRLLEQHGQLKNRFRHFSFGINNDMEVLSNNENDPKIKELKAIVHQMKRRSEKELNTTAQEKRLSNNYSGSDIFIKTTETVVVEERKEVMVEHKDTVEETNGEPKPEVYDKLYNYNVRVKSNFGKKRADETIMESLEESQILTLSGIQSKKTEVDEILNTLINDNEADDATVGRVFRLKSDLDLIFGNLAQMANTGNKQQRDEEGKLLVQNKELQNLVDGQNFILKAIETQNKQLTDLLKRANNRYLSKELTNEETGGKIDELMVSLKQAKERYLNMFESCKAVLSSD